MKVFYVPNALGYEDVAVEQDGQYVSFIGQKTLAQMQEKHPTIELIEYDVWYIRQQETFKQEPKVITQERFNEMRDVLPPKDWVAHGGSESFKSIENLMGSMTNIFVRVHDAYYELVDCNSLTHAMILKRVCDYLDKKAQEAA